MRVDFDNLPYRASEELRSLADRVIGIPRPDALSLCFRSADLSPEIEPACAKTVDGWLQRGCRFIYCIWSDASTEQIAEIRRIFTIAKAEEKDSRAYARLNPLSTSTCFYVGGSASLGRRFREHLGFGARGT